MTALQTEVLTTDELVKIAHKQIDAFNNGDWEQMRGLLASDAQYHELGTERALEDGVPGRNRHGHVLRGQR